MIFANLPQYSASQDFSRSRENTIKCDNHDFVLIFPSLAVVLNWGDLAPRGHVTMSGDILGVTDGGGGVGVQGVEARGAA